MVKKSTRRSCTKVAGILGICQEREHKLQQKLLGPDIFRRGGGLSREGVRAKKLGMSLEPPQKKQTFLRDVPGCLPGCPRITQKTRKSLRKCVSRSPKAGHNKAGRSDFRNQRFEPDAGKMWKMRKVPLTPEKNKDPRRIDRAKTRKMRTRKRGKCG